MSQNRHPNYMRQLNELKAGDVILFRSSIIPGIVSHGIMTMQSLVSQPHGHYDTTHVAICTDYNEDKPIIAHIIGSGYKKEPLENAILREGGDRAFLVYRPTNRDVAIRLAMIAGEEKTNGHIRWDISAAAGSFVRTATLNPNRSFFGRSVTKEDAGFSASSFCSKFTIEAMKIATDPDAKERVLEDAIYYPNLCSSSTPKALEAYLFNEVQLGLYSMYVYPGNQNPYTLIKNEIQAQINRIRLRVDANSMTKCKKLREQLIAITRELDAKPELDDLQKSLRLLNKIAPVLKLQTGYGIRASESYRSLIATSRMIGIFERDIEAAMESIPDSSSHIKKTL